MESMSIDEVAEWFLAKGFPATVSEGFCGEFVY